MQLDAIEQRYLHSSSIPTGEASTSGKDYQRFVAAEATTEEQYADHQPSRNPDPMPGTMVSRGINRGGRGLNSVASPLDRRATSPASGADATSSPVLDLATTRPESPHREPSWTTMFDGLFDNLSHNQKAALDKCSITYLGESFPLGMVLEEVNEGGRTRLHHPGPPVSEPSVVEEPSGQRHPSHMQPEDIAYLKAKGAFTFPDADKLDALVTTYLGRVYPLYPIVNRQEFIRQYEADEVPAMLLHAVCSIAATFCDLALIHRAGFSSRLDARLASYRKAKALFEVGYETDKIVQLQSAVYMTFWGGGPTNHWNYFSWIGTAVTIAESLGIHRSMANADMDVSDRSLLKRLWWTLVNRDAHCQSLVGRPFRINQEQVDIEPLVPEDFEEDMRSPEFKSHPLRTAFALYQIHMSRLSLILKDIVNARFRPGRLQSRAAVLYDKLLCWRHELPGELQWVDGDANLDVFVLCLCTSYNHHLILLHQDQPPMGGLASTTQENSLLKRSIPSPEIAARNITCLVYTIYAKSNPLCIPHETFQGVFLAEAVMFTQMKASDLMTAQHGRAALSACQMLWHAVLETWDASPWILRLFDHLVGRLGLPSDRQNDPSWVATGESSTGALHADEFVDDFGDTLPTLSTFLDMTQDGGALSNFVDFPIFSGSLGLTDPSLGMQ
ncbi:Fungal specific transcription factor domain-containing protein [Cladophialophora immunda]|nr:Fungal specific transcription factor domain-containing protein [Cladophialophora immunda]